MATPALVVRFYIKNFSTNYLPIFGQVRYLSDNFLSGKPNSGCVLTYLHNAEIAKIGQLQYSSVSTFSSVGLFSKKKNWQLQYLSGNRTT